jgi:RsiW-degrading membrane proteinase PrsW (M82 family)
VQILFGFLLTVVFQQRFGDLSATDRHLYVATVVLGAATTGSLVGPVTMHRLLTGQRLKPETVRWAARMTVLGLFLLLGTMACSLLQVLRVVSGVRVSTWIVAGIIVWFLLCWLGFPLWVRRRSRD